MYFAQDAKIRVKVRGGGSDAGIGGVARGEADIGMVSRALRPDESARVAATPIGHDGIALVVHERNPLARLTSDQVGAVFSGRTSEWRELGIPKLGRTIPVIKSPGRATRALFDAHFNVGSLVPPRAVELGSNLAILLYVSSDPDAIGYASIGSLHEARRRGLKVKGVALDGVEPTQSACGDSRYPLCRPLLLVTRRAPRAEVRRFVDYLVSTAGQAIVARHEFQSASQAQP